MSSQCALVTEISRPTKCLPPVINDQEIGHKKI
jgi:hypothetical protein